MSGLPRTGDRAGHGIEPRRPGYRRAIPGALVLSPHLDDAALSAWSALCAGGARVVNVCAGIPAPGTLGFWDRRTGATDSAARMAERLDEDRRALDAAGVSARNLPFLDDQYRDGAIAAAELDAALAPELGGADVVYAPAGLGDHCDHVAVREAALRLSAVPVRLYAELPYATRTGWPPWVTAAAPGEGPATDGRWTADVALPGGLRALTPRVRTLSEPEAARKVQALRHYASQFAALDGMGAISSPGVRRWEVFWEARP